MQVESSKKQDNLILPNSNFVLGWSIFFSVCIIAYFAIAVFEVCFRLNQQKLLNKTPEIISITCFCIIDSLIFANIGIILKGKLVKNRYNNLVNYTQSWLFISDSLVLIVLIVRFTLGLLNNQQYGFLLSVLDLVIGLKFFNIKRYDQMLKFYYFNQLSLLVYEFVKYTIFLAFLCHIVGCAFYLIDSLLIQSQWYPPSQYWLISSQAMPNLYYAPLGQQYLYSFYFAIVTLSTVAYGDITPLNQTQVIFVVCILAFLLMFYIYIFTQIYEVFNFFNRKSIKIQQDRYKLANFLKQFKISTHLSGRIVNQFQYREKNQQKTNKELFINDISVKLAKTYSSMPYKCNINEFIPKFIKHTQINLQIFNQTLTQKFFAPEQYFFPVQFTNDDIEKNIYFVGNKVVYRSIHAGTSQIQLQAEKDRWLGVNMFLTSQFDVNQKWKVQTPTELPAMNYKTLINFIKCLQKPYQKFLEQCHRSTFNCGSYEDISKCLICWKSQHNTLYCSQYRPQIKRQRGRKLRKTSIILLIRKLIQQIEFNKRKPFIRTYKKSNKTMKSRHYKIQTMQNETQTDVNSTFYQNKLKKKSIERLQQIVKDWRFYMTNFNITNYMGNLEISFPTQKLQP